MRVILEIFFLLSFTLESWKKGSTCLSFMTQLFLVVYWGLMVSFLGVPGIHEDFDDGRNSRVLTYRRMSRELHGPHPSAVLTSKLKSQVQQGVPVRALLLQSSNAVAKKLSNPPSFSMSLHLTWHAGQSLAIIEGNHRPECRHLKSRQKGCKGVMQRP